MHTIKRVTLDEKTESRDNANLHILSTVKVTPLSGKEKHPPYYWPSTFATKLEATIENDCATAKVQTIRWLMFIFAVLLYERNE